MKYPLNKYKFFAWDNKVVAVSTYAGKIVRGVATCDSTDEFSLEKGQKLAAARCNAKIAAKRKARADKKLREAVRLVDLQTKHMNKMASYVYDSDIELKQAHVDLDNILKSM